MWLLLSRTGIKRVICISRALTSPTMSSGIVRKFRTRDGVSTLVVFPKTQDAIDRPEEWNRQWEEFYQHPDFPGPTQLVNGYRGIRNPRANLDFFFLTTIISSMSGSSAWST